MAFWDKQATKNIKNALKEVDDNVKRVKTIDLKKTAVEAAINTALENIPPARQEIVKSADDNKAKPWIDKKFDAQINNAEVKELEALDKLERTLADDKELLTLVENENDLAVVATNLNSEASKIKIRENASSDLLKKSEAETLSERLTKASDTPPARKTKDGVSWSNVTKVARQLGGWLECKGKTHACELVFPNAKRKVPLSSDVHSGALAEQIRNQLPNFLPEHKIPTKQKLRTAFVSGDIRLAA